MRSAGGLLPRDVLGLIAAGSSSIPVTDARSYGFESTADMNAAISRSWHALSDRWQRTQSEQNSEAQAGAGFTRQRWLLPLLVEFGHQPEVTHTSTISGKSYPISHVSAGTALHLVGFEVGLDQRQRGVAGAASASPHSMVQEFLNRSEDHLWAIVSNGNFLRVLRDNASLTRQAYVEFNLAEIFEGQQYADFRQLWLLCHASRWEPTKGAALPLEQWAQAAATQSVRAMDSLRDGVQQALQELGSGFIQHPANEALRSRLRSGDLSSQELYAQLLRLVYRLVFLATAEARDLLIRQGDSEARTRYERYYSIGRLVDLAWSRVGSQHEDIWCRQRVVFEVLAGEAPGEALGIEALGSDLWSSQSVADLEVANIDNRSVLAALRALSSLTVDGQLRRVDFAVTGAEELGSVYESLLELEVQVDLSVPSFKLGLGDEHERKSTGSYYTPTDLAERLLDWTLEPALAEAMASPDPEEAILRLTVLDPACGSGHFLVAAAHRIGSWLASIRSGEDHPSTEEVELGVRDAISHCLYGVDLNPMAVELCKTALWMESLSPGLPLSFVDHRIKAGNSLLGTTPSLIAAGIPDQAFTPADGDDKAIARSLKNQNAAERRGESGFDFEASDSAGAGLTRWQSLEDMPETTLPEVQAKAKAFSAADALLDEDRNRADLWCASFLVDKAAGAPIITTDALHQTHSELAAITSAVRTEYAPFHWHLEFPEVFVGESNDAVEERGGFDVVVGNPPFLNQLELATAATKKLASLLKVRYPGVAKGYADTATIFLELASQLAKADGGRLGFVQPDSVLAASDARGARSSLMARGALEVLWVAGEKVFTANVLTCAPVVRNGPYGDPWKLRRFKGSDFEELPPKEIDGPLISGMDTWAPLISEGFGIPPVELEGEGTMADFLAATADFRDQYYGLVPFVEEAEGRRPDGKQWAALVTTGLIDPLTSLWGERATKFNKCNFDAPVVDLQRLRHESNLGDWADKRLVPKLLLATQTKVIEVVVDDRGVLLPSVPVISVMVHGTSIWHAAAALMSPPVTAWAAARYMGAALSTDALKLSAKQVEGLPAPARGELWDRAASEVQRAALAEDTGTWLQAVREAGDLMCAAYEVDEPADLMEWWLARLPAWQRVEQRS